MIWGEKSILSSTANPTYSKIIHQAPENHSFKIARHFVLFFTENYKHLSFSYLHSGFLKFMIRFQTFLQIPEGYKLLFFIK